MRKERPLWFFEEMDMMKMMCPTKMMSGRMNEFPIETFKKGEYIFLPEDKADKIYFVMEGRVKIGIVGENEREITKSILQKGEVFGELPLVGESKRRDFAMAMEETQICILDINQMKSMMRDHNGISLFMMKIMGSRMLEMEKRLEYLVFKDSRSRIIQFLEDLVEKRGQRVGYEYVVRKFITHQEIANMTATSRQSVTTVLNELRNKNLITFNRKRLLVRDLKQLAEEKKIII